MALSDIRRELRGKAAEQVLRHWPDLDAPVSNFELIEAVGRGRVVAAFTELKEAGIVELDMRQAGMLAALTPEGKRVALDVRAAYARGGPFWVNDLRRKLLAWIKDFDRAKLPVEFAQTESAADAEGERYSPEQVISACRFLDDYGLIDGGKFDSRFGTISARITYLGESALFESDVTLEDYVLHRMGGGQTMNDNRDMSSNTLNNYGNLGAAVAGRNEGTIAVSQTITQDQRELALNLLDRLAAKPEVQDNPELSEKVADLRGEVAKPEPNKESLRTKLLGAFMVTAGTQLGQGVLPLLQQIGQALGVS